MVYFLYSVEPGRRKSARERNTPTFKAADRMSVPGHSRRFGRTDHSDFRSTPVNGHAQDRRSRLKGARTRRPSSGPAQVYREFRKPSSGYRTRRRKPAIFCAHPSVKRRGVRVSFDHKVFRSQPCRCAGCPNKKSSANTASQRGRLNEQLEQVGFLADHPDLRDANDFSVLLRNDNRG